MNHPPRYGYADAGDQKTKLIATNRIKNNDILKSV